jgi:hypothetical protein
VNCCVCEALNVAAAGDTTIEFAAPTEPPAPETEIAAPAGDVATAPLMPIAAAVESGASTVLITATMPLLIALEFVPIARHRYAAALPVQVSVFPAEINAGPGATLNAVRPVEGYENVHCRPEGWLPDVEVRESVKEAATPGTATTDDRDKDDCPNAVENGRNKLAISK